MDSVNDTLILESFIYFLLKVLFSFCSPFLSGLPLGVLWRQPTTVPPVLSIIPHGARLTLLFSFCCDLVKDGGEHVGKVGGGDHGLRPA